jgi:DNA replication protein DnaC
MKNEIEAMITDITATTAEAEDYTGEDGLLYCGKCHTPKEAYFPEGKTCFGRDRHPTDCDCQKAAREKREAAESDRSTLKKWRT